MKKTLAIFAGLLLASSAFADVGILRNEYGSGQPGARGFERAIPVGENDELLHAPQYLPQYPTAAPIWPRVVEVPCTKAANGDVLCEGYNWQPKMGRGEYLFIKPRMIEPVVPQIIEKPIVILKEVPRKPKRE